MYNIGGYEFKNESMLINVVIDEEQELKDAIKIFLEKLGNHKIYLVYNGIYLELNNRNKIKDFFNTLAHFPTIEFSILE